MKDYLLVATLQILQLAVMLWGFYLVVYHTLGKRIFRYSPGEVVGLALRSILRLAWWVLNTLVELLLQALSILFNGNYSMDRQRRRHRQQGDGAYWLRGLRRWKVLRRSQNGLVIDGRRRISQAESFRHLALVAPTGSGKTTAYVLPNLLRLEPPCSAIVTDPSGEIYAKTSGSLAGRGFEVKVLNVSDAAGSLGYNPLARATTPTEIEEVCNVLVGAAYGATHGDQRFWNNGAKTILSVLVRCLKEQPSEFQNLHNLNHLLNLFGVDGKPLYRFVAKYADELTFSEFKGFMSNSEKVIQGMVATARAALKPFADPELCRLTAVETLGFETLRERPTVLYLIVPEHKMGYYGFLLSVFWTQFLAFAMQMPKGDESYLPIYCFLDEFGNISRIPGFETTITAVRKRQVSLSVILQDVEQLVATYGKAGASTILNGGCASRLYLPGLGHETCRNIEQMLGRQTIRENGREMTRSLLTADEVRTLEDNEAIYVFANRRPVLLRMKPFYKGWRLRSRAKLAPATLPAADLPQEVAYLSIPSATLRQEKLPQEKPIQEGAGQPAQERVEKDKKPSSTKREAVNQAELGLAVQSEVAQMLKAVREAVSLGAAQAAESVARASNYEQIPPQRKYTAEEVRVRLYTGRDPNALSDAERKEAEGEALSVRSIERLVASGVLEKTVIGGRRFFSEAQVQTYERRVAEGKVKRSAARRGGKAK